MSNEGPKRPARPGERTWNQVVPAPGQTWTSLLRPTDPPELIELHELLDAGVLTLWQDDRGHYRFARGASLFGMAQPSVSTLQRETAHGGANGVKQ